MNFLLLKIIFLTGIIGCMPGFALAQENGRNELRMGVGSWASENVIADIIALWASTVFDGEPTAAKIGGPAWSVSYKYHVARRLAIGGSSSYNPNVYSWLYDYEGDDWKRRGLTTAGEVTVFWQRAREFEFYAMGGVGFSTIHSSYANLSTRTNFRYATQVTPIGLRMGTKVGAFIELGYGYKGIFNGGLSVRF